MPARLRHYSFQDYLMVEERNPVRHEFLGEQYQQLPSLKAVVYVWQDRRQIEVRARTGGVWQSETIGTRGVAAIEALACTLDVDALYARAGG